LVLALLIAAARFQRSLVTVWLSLPSSSSSLLMSPGN
jgi:hypothetical protein